MPATRNNTHTEEKRFRLVKFFAYASLIVLLIFCFPFSVLLSQNAKDILMKSYENYAIMLGENLCHQIYQNFAIPVTARYGKISLRQEEQQALLDQVVRNTVHGFHVDLVNVYDIEQGIISYSTNPNLLGKKEVPGLGFKKAVQGEHSSGLISEGGSFWGLGMEMFNVEKKLNSYIPIRGMNPYTGEKTEILGVLELTQNLSREYRSVIKLQYLIFGLSLLIMALIFVALLLIVHKAERIIEQRAGEQLELETQLNQSERLAALGQMVAGVSHEIRNPLGIIRSTAELLAQMGEFDPTQKKLSNVIIEASSRLNNIVTEFLDFARPKTPNREECRLDEIVDRILSFMSPELEKEKVAVHNHIDGRPLKIYADPHLLYMAFLNILLNAVQSMKNGGTITIRAEEERKHYLIQTEDTGIGINSDAIKKVFDPFFSTKDKGSGLGLSIVRNIIESHNGIIWLESSPGSGTTVNIKLPKE